MIANATVRPSAWTANSRCECQASLRADLDEDLQVLRGSAFFHGKRELAPAHALLGGATGGATPRFDLHWACPFCTRNVLRSFTAGALQRVRAASTSI